MTKRGVDELLPEEGLVLGYDGTILDNGGSPLGDLSIGLVIRASDLELGRVIKLRLCNSLFLRVHLKSSRPLAVFEADRRWVARARFPKDRKIVAVAFFDLARANRTVEAAAFFESYHFVLCPRETGGLEVIGIHLGNSHRP